MKPTKEFKSRVAWKCAIFLLVPLVLVLANRVTEDITWASLFAILTLGLIVRAVHPEPL